MKEPKLLPAPPPKGALVPLLGIPGLLWAQAAKKSAVSRKSREKFCKQGEKKEITDIATAGKQFLPLTIKIEKTALCVCHMNQAVAVGACVW